MIISGRPEELAIDMLERAGDNIWKTTYFEASCVKKYMHKVEILSRLRT